MFLNFKKSGMRSNSVNLFLLATCLLVLPLGVAEANPNLAFFESKIRPILVTHCQECHSAKAASEEKLKAGLFLDSREGLLKGGENGPAIKPGKPSESILLAAMKYSGLEMPPKQKLPQEVIANFEKWILDGAFDPREGTATVKKQGMSVEEGRKFWSLIRPEKKLPPKEGDTWSSNAVDLFIFAKLREKQISPSPEADPLTLVRRLYFTLTGLPPTEDEVHRFLQSLHKKPQHALPELVDSLLASTHFGEKWGRHWLDVARYADSNGRDRNIFNYHAWHYRDYVIQAFNTDLPYNQFLREQIAGDLLHHNSPEDKDKKTVATAFLAMGSKAFEESKPDVFRMDVIDEQIELIGRSILGLSMGCARCHNHKFDPISTADYYSLAGIFRSTQPLYGYTTMGIKATAFAHTELQAIGPNSEKLAPQGLAFMAKLQELTLAQNTARSDRYRVVRALSAAKLDIQKPGADTSKLSSEIKLMEEKIKEWDVKVKRHEAELQTAMDNPPAMPAWTMAVRESQKPDDCKIHIRGDTLTLGDLVPRGMPKVFSITEKFPIPANQSGRLELANWLIDPENPLTARVYVNRVWQHIFGRGLVTTPDDFGVNGSKPSHPELLDYLAVHFMEQGWSTKKLIRELVLSKTYLQSGSLISERSEKAGEKFTDPDNVLVSQIKPHRLEAEALRDAIMQVAGTLDKSPLKPERGFLAKFNPYRENEYRNFSPLFMPPDIQLPNRSVYLPVVRGVLPEMFQLFDFASPDRVTAQREESLVPAQALFFMNNPWLISQARILSENMLKDPGLDDSGRVAKIYKRAFSRDATVAEIQRALVYLNKPESVIPNPKANSQPSMDQLRLERWTSFCQLVFGSAEFRYVR